MKRKHESQKYYINMSLMFLRDIDVVDVKIAKESCCTRWGQWSSSSLKVVAIQL